MGILTVERMKLTNSTKRYKIINLVHYVFLVKVSISDIAYINSSHFQQAKFFSLKRSIQRFNIPFGLREFFWSLADHDC